MNVRSLLAALLFFAAASSVARAEDKPVTDQEVRTTINSHMGDLKPCLSADNGVAGGTLKVEFYIKPDGHVSEAKVGSPSDNAKIDKCIIAAFKGFSFPKPRDGRLFFKSYPFKFTQKAVAKVGTLTEEQINGAIKPKMGDIQSCFTEAVKKKADLGGQLEVGIAVAPTGTVAEVETLNSSTGSPELDACVIAKVKLVAFPKPTNNGEASFKYPFVFKPTGAPEKKADEKK